ncbi:hypothetical protein [Candidatus Poriferisodalis sp.]|uniref:hypothetical protein n=1 Tax=Candidatus Poriferisodalis sp. TaxID=3101277 RepID=UPI003B51CC44
MSIVDALDRVCRRLDEIRACVRWAEAIVREGGSDAERRASNEIRAASFIAACGAMEQFFRAFVEWLCGEIGQSGLRYVEIRLSLHSIASSGDFRSLQSLRERDPMFGRRMDLLNRTVSTKSCSLKVPRDELGLGGETIRPGQVSNVWAVFGLPGSGFEDLGQEVAMRVLADSRNDYAHGRVDISTFLAHPECEPSRFLDRISALEEWCFHCWSAGLEYLDSQGYRR